MTDGFPTNRGDTMTPDFPRNWRVAARLRDWLQARAVDPRELALAVGVFEQVVSLWLDGQALPSPQQQLQIAAYLRVDPAHFQET